ncbi:MAG: TetR/AcrR family transcriptional regulator [Oscillospiraceae bacterium]
MKLSQGQKEDQRVRLTRQLLQNALLQLLGERPVGSVTVTQLCERAGVNRGTFYLHYRDVYDLLQQMEEALLEDLDVLLGAAPVVGTGEAEAEADVFMGAIIRFMEKNWEMCAVLLGDNGDKKFVAAIVERAREKSVQEYRRHFPGVPRRKVEVFYQFIAWGFVGLIQYSLAAPGALDAGTLAASGQQIVLAAAGFLEAH